MMDARKPTATVIAGDRLIVVCDDGSVWSTSADTPGEPWTERKPVPGSQADAEDSN